VHVVKTEGIGLLQPPTPGAPTQAHAESNFLSAERYMESGRRGITFALNQVEQVGFVPGLIGLPDADQVEALLTCFYALEAIAAAELCMTV